MHPLLHGGGQERGLRSGTENVAAIVGFGAACELATANLSAKATHTNRLRQHLEAKLKELDAVVFAQTVERIPNTSFFAFEGVDGETLVTALDKLGFSVASGSACSSYSTEPSHVLLAMGIDNDTAQGAVRVSVGADNSLTDIEGFLISLKQALSQLKSMPAIAA
jgi:cysteine desulfurase